MGAKQQHHAGLNDDVVRRDAGAVQVSDRAILLIVAAYSAVFVAFGLAEAWPVVVRRKDRSKSPGSVVPALQPLAMPSFSAETEIGSAVDSSGPCRVWSSDDSRVATADAGIAQ